MRRRRIDGDARRRHLGSVSNSCFTRARVNARSVTHAAIMQDFVTAGRAALEPIFDIESEDWRELFHRQGKVTSYSADIDHQASRSRRRGDAGNLCDDLDGLAHDRRIQTSL